MRAHNDSAILIILALAVVLELIALGCGIIARRTVPGKAGIIISGSSLALGVLFAMWMIPAATSMTRVGTHTSISTPSTPPAVLTTPRSSPSTQEDFGN